MSAVIFAGAVCATQAVPPAPEKPSAAINGGNVHFRGSLTNSRIQFEKFRKGHVAFIGGSITEMNGYRPMVCDILRRRFPKTRFTFTDAGIASTCSTTGAFRLERDVLSKGPVDLLFVEFAVNDDQDAAHTRRECIRGMEGIVRHARRHNPNMDIVITYFCNPGMIQMLQAGKVPVSIAAHEAVARHYGIPSIDLAREVAEQIAAGKLSWEKYGGTHPKPFGNAICAGMIDNLMSAVWSEALRAEAEKTPHPVPEKPLDADSYASGRFVDPSRAAAGDGWRLGRPRWKELAGQCRARFADAPLLCADRPGAELTLAFQGKAVGAYVLAGPDAGTVEASIDGGPVKAVDLYHRFSRSLHYPRTVMFAADLEPGRHSLKLRISDRKNTQSTGHAVRILQFTAN